MRKLIEKKIKKTKSGKVVSKTYEVRTRKKKETKPKQKSKVLDTLYYTGAEVDQSKFLLFLQVEKDKNGFPTGKVTVNRTIRKNAPDGSVLGKTKKSSNKTKKTTKPKKQSKGFFGKLGSFFS